MSAYVLSHAHINSLLNYCNHPRRTVYLYLHEGDVLKPDYHEDMQRAAEILYAQNIASVNARYPDTITNPESTPGKTCEIGTPIKYRFSCNNYSAVQILKLCQCYDYQSCETGRDYPDTDAARIVDCIRTAAINALPGYEQADWSI
ncbi:hypothetical protein [Caudoviricetes sp.]|nr:hypothetical protein [Caudoviricetes sp.]UOF81122.1 hypothetical protein [Caudoviricetes sp.]UOF82242.1 hypothetical protein [Caudoviricetes sp.]UOF82467.1 hypothetical protein [Caudoviricetes sp.]UOF82621.1 hypothetical protein [Caudoviricetes sp.]